MTEPMTSNVTDTALLFEGGGMRAALTSAVVAELLRQRIHVDFVAGISAGSSNAVNCLSRDPARARRSRSCWPAARAPCWTGASRPAWKTWRRWRSPCCGTAWR